MRPLIALVGIALVSGMLVADAEAQQRQKPRRDDAEEQTYKSYNRRPSTVDQRGNCIRDTGRPADQLNLSQKCDREEFWQRFNDRGGGRGN